MSTGITEDVVRDLIVLIEAGEASADTRSLVDAYLAEHPHLNEERGRVRGDESRLPDVARPPTTGTSAERAALRRTKALLRMRGWFQATAIFFTALPFSFAVRNGDFRWLLWPDHAQTCVASLALGIAGWIAFATVASRLRPRGF